MRYTLFILCLALAACGGSGGADAGGGTAPGIVGTRSVPGGAVRMERTAPEAFRITSDVADVRTVEVFRGAGYESALPVVVGAAPDGGWTGTAPVGSPLLVRMTLGDGSVVESAPGDFTMP
jgi:hypothetical protein